MLGGRKGSKTRGCRDEASSHESETSEDTAQRERRERGSRETNHARLQAARRMGGRGQRAWQKAAIKETMVEAMERRRWRGGAGGGGQRKLLCKTKPVPSSPWARATAGRQNRRKAQWPPPQRHRPAAPQRRCRPSLVTCCRPSLLPALSCSFLCHSILFCIVFFFYLHFYLPPSLWPSARLHAPFP